MIKYIISGVTIAGVASFKSLAPHPSGSVDLWMSSANSVFYTSCVDMAGMVKASFLPNFDPIQFQRV